MVTFVTDSLTEGINCDPHAIAYRVADDFVDTAKFGAVSLYDQYDFERHEIAGLIEPSVARGMRFGRLVSLQLLIDTLEAANG